MSPAALSLTNGLRLDSRGNTVDDGRSLRIFSSDDHVSLVQAGALDVLSPSATHTQNTHHIII